MVETQAFHFIFGQPNSSQFIWIEKAQSWFGDVILSEKNEQIAEIQSNI